MPETQPSKRATAQGIAPHFVVPDVANAAEYYRDEFGFEILGYFAEPPVFAMVRRDKIIIQFGKLNPGAVSAPNSQRRAFGSTPTSGSTTPAPFLPNSNPAAPISSKALSAGCTTASK